MRCVGRATLILLPATKSLQVGQILEDPYDEYFRDLPRSEADPELLAVRRFNRLWVTIQDWLRQPNSYLFITGKSAGFSLIGLQRYHGFKISSPTRYHYLLLGALFNRDIEELYERVHVVSLTLQVYVRATPELQKQLCDRLQQETVGLPHLVQYYLEALCRLERGPLLLRSLTQRSPGRASTASQPLSSCRHCCCLQWLCWPRAGACAARAP